MVRQAIRFVVRALTSAGFAAFSFDHHSKNKQLDLLFRSDQKEKPQTLLIVSHQLSGLDDFIDYHLTMNHQHLNYVGGRYES